MPANLLWARIEQLNILKKDSCTSYKDARSLTRLKEEIIEMGV